MIIIGAENLNKLRELVIKREIYLEIKKGNLEKQFSTITNLFLESSLKKMEKNFKNLYFFN